MTGTMKAKEMRLNVAFVLGQIALAMHSVEHAPLLVGEVDGVLQALKCQVT